MLGNALAMIVYQAQRLLKNPDAPMLFSHVERNGDMWQVVVARVPKQEAKAA